MSHRPPTRHDIGKTVEVRNHDNENWKSIKLVSIDYDENSEPMYWERDGEIPGDRLHFYYQCRVPYTTADPLTELSIAADLLAENGMDEAARVLLDRVSLLEQMHSMTDMADAATFTEYQAAYNQIRRQIMESLNIPKSLVAPNPPEQL